MLVRNSLFLFTARPCDSDTQLQRPFDSDAQLQNNLNRWYDFRVGRWLSEDPIGFNGGDGNLYRYVGNVATRAQDFLGLKTAKECRALEIAVIGHLYQWARKMDNLITDTYSNMSEAIKLVLHFWSSAFEGLTVAGGVSDLVSGLVAVGKPEVAGVSVVADFVIHTAVNVAGSVNAASNREFRERLLEEMEVKRDRERKRVDALFSKEWEAFRLAASKPGSGPNDCCPALEEYARDLKTRLPLLTTSAPRIMDIYGALLLSLARRRGWEIRGSYWNLENFGHYWWSSNLQMPFTIDAQDIVAELNRIQFGFTLDHHRR